MTTPAAGWYPDPGGSGGQRYWNGTVWTDQVTPQAVHGSPLPGLADLPGQSAPAEDSGGEDSSAVSPGSVEQSGSGGIPGSGSSTSRGQWPPLSPPVASQGTNPEVTGQGDATPATGSGRPETAPTQPHPSGYGVPERTGGPAWGSTQAPGVDYQQRVDPRLKLGPDGQPLAGWWRRFAGYLIDSVIIGIVTGLFVLVLGTVSGFLSEVVNVSALEDLMSKIEKGAAADAPYQPTSEEMTAVLGSGFMTMIMVAILISTILSVLNGVVLVARSGQTVGDRVVQTRKVVAGRRPPSLGRALLRWLIPTALILLSNVQIIGIAAYAAWMVDHLRPLWDGQRQTWHDKAASTYVERADLAGPLIK